MVIKVHVGYGGNVERPLTLSFRLSVAPPAGVHHNRRDPSGADEKQTDEGQTILILTAPATHSRAHTQAQDPPAPRGLRKRCVFVCVLISVLYLLHLQPNLFIEQDAPSQLPAP